MTAKTFDELSYSEQRLALAAFGYHAESLTKYANVYTVSANGQTITQRQVHEFANVAWDDLTASEQAELRSVLLSDDDDPESWLYSRIEGGAVWTRQARIRTPEEIADAIRQWERDPLCMDLEDWPGMQQHRAQLAEHHRNFVAANRAARNEREEAAVKSGLQWKMVMEEINKLRAEISELRERLVEVEADDLDNSQRIEQMEELHGYGVDEAERVSLAEPLHDALHAAVEA